VVAAAMIDRLVHHAGSEPGSWGGAVVGYLWRYVGDGGGIGITFFVLAAAVGLGRRSRRDIVLAAVAFAVFPVWAGLIGTVALAPRGQEMLFPLTATTVTLSLIGHLIFGFVLGLGFWHARAAQNLWPWRPVDVKTVLSLLESMRNRQRDPAEVEHETDRNLSRATYEEWQRELEWRRSGTGGCDVPTAPRCRCPDASGGRRSPFRCAHRRRNDNHRIESPITRTAHRRCS
jgi:hypothetical protein